MMYLQKQGDCKPHIGKVVTVEKTREKGEKKEDDSISSTLVPGISVTQQLFATTDFLDAPDNKQEGEDRKTDGFDNASLKSPNLLANTDDEQDETILERDHTTVGTNTKEVETPEEKGRGDVRKRAWWVACTSCEELFPCVWDQYGKSARENDGVLNLMIGSHNQPPLIVRRKRAFVHVATLLFG
jgi:hypothetical protein